MTAAPFDDTAFTVGSDTYTWGDVVLAAMLWGEWQPLRERVRQGLACVKHAAATDQAASSDDVEEAIDEFRYNHNLITGAEAEAWLTSWGLNGDQLFEFSERALLRQRWADDLDTIVAAQSVDDDEIDACCWAEAVFSKDLWAFCQKLAGRAAASAKLREEGRAGDVEGAAVTADTANLPREELSRLGLGEIGDRTARLVALDGYFEQFCQQLWAARSTRDQIRAHQLDWIRVEGHYAFFADQGMAQEAVLCVKQDGMPLADIAAEARAETDEFCCYLDDLEAELRSPFIGASKGDLLGPLPWRSGFGVFHLRDKQLPSLDDDDTRRRAEEKSLDAAVSREVTARVVWNSNL